jgi:hypothetical protein
MKKTKRDKLQLLLKMRKKVTYSPALDVDVVELVVAVVVELVVVVVVELVVVVVVEPVVAVVVELVAAVTVP